MNNDHYILIIEDNAFIRMQIAAFLKEGGYKVFEASKAEEAVAILKGEKQKISCMLVDVKMEPEDGFDFLNKVHAMNINIPAILVTGDSNPDVLEKASNLGVGSVLMKPVNRDRLLQMIERIIATAGSN